MTDLSAFPITRRWRAEHLDRLQLYSVPTPNGVKVSIMLEETGLAYEPHYIPLGEAAGTKSTEFRSLNPNGKIPAIIDPNGPDGAPIGLFESGAILIYLADKRGMLLPRGARRYETIQWVMFQMGGIGPMFGQVGFFNKFAGREWEDKRPLQRYVAEAKRLLGVLEARLDGREWIMDDYSIADIATLGWVRNLITFYDARELVEFESFANVSSWLERGLARPAVQRGLTIPARL